MLVTRTTFDSVLEDLRSEDVLSLDTETTGLYPYHGDRLFCIIIANVGNEAYFNFKEYQGLPADMVLTKDHLAQMQTLFDDKRKLWFIHDAKYDRSILRQDNLIIKGTCHCTKTQGRVLYNEWMSYTLDDLGQKIGYKKDDKVKEYIKAHKLVTKVDINGTSINKKRYDLVPFDLIVPYGCKDARICYAVGTHQTLEIKKRANQMTGSFTVEDVMKNEYLLDDALHDIETVGIKVDLDYCRSAMDYYSDIMDTTAEKFKEMTGHEFVLSAKCFEKVFIEEKEKWKYTETGKMATGEDDLKLLTHPAAKIILAYKKAQAEINFYKNFIFFADTTGSVHTTYNSGGTRTGGRLSSSSPNMQNLKKDRTEADINSRYRVRRAVIPRDGYFLAMIDYDQIEYRLMADYAKCVSLNDKIVNEGLDVHTATAQLADIDRDTAKTVNFLTLYGGGVPLLAINLYDTWGTEEQIKVMYYKMQGWDNIINKEPKFVKAQRSITPELERHNKPLLEKAQAIQDSIFNAAPELKTFIKGVKDAAKDRGFIHNWYGRVSYFPRKRMSYKAPNTLIQGGAGEVMKVAMVRIVRDFLRNKKSRVIMNVHDELVIEVDFDEEEILPKIKGIMESVYPFKQVPLTCGIDVSLQSLADKEKWTGVGWLSEKTGNSI